MTDIAAAHIATRDAIRANSAQVVQRKVNHNGWSAEPSATPATTSEPVGQDSPLHQAAAAHGVDLDTLLDSVAFERRLAQLEDPEDPSAVAEAIREAIEANPHLAAPQRPAMKPNPAQGHSGAPAPTRTPQGQGIRALAAQTLEYSDNERARGPRRFWRKGRTMTTTKTAAPMTAAEARRLADELAAAESDLATRRRAARRAASMTKADELLLEPSRELSAAWNAALEHLNRAVKDPAVGIADLFDAWQAARIASAVRAQHESTAAALYDQHDGRPARPLGDYVDRSNRVAKFDAAAESLPSFDAILTTAVAERAAAAASSERVRVEQAVDEAGSAAEQAVG